MFTTTLLISSNESWWGSNEIANTRSVRKRKTRPSNKKGVDFRVDKRWINIQTQMEGEKRKSERGNVSNRSWTASSRFAAHEGVPFTAKWNFWATLHWLKPIVCNSSWNHRQIGNITWKSGFKYHFSSSRNCSNAEVFFPVTQIANLSTIKEVTELTDNHMKK